MAVTGGRRVATLSDRALDESYHIAHHSTAPHLTVPAMHACMHACRYIWFGFFSSIPHKEERFLTPIYPLFCLVSDDMAPHTIPLLLATYHLISRH